MRSSVISIAGFDPSAGAGILQDVKTMENLGIRGFGVCSAITFQTEDEFFGVSWIPPHQIQLQFDLLMKKYDVQVMKIGLIQSIEVLDELVSFIRKKYPEIKIVWDPILRASAGFRFHDGINEALMYEILSQIFLVTPNVSEATALMEMKDEMKAVESIARFCNVVVKSYQNESGVYDILIENGKKDLFPVGHLTEEQKHGSGCVYSAALTSFLASGRSLRDACLKAQNYTIQFLDSEKGLLGSHKKIQSEQHA